VFVQREPRLTFAERLLHIEDIGDSPDPVVPELRQGIVLDRGWIDVLEVLHKDAQQQVCRRQALLAVDDLVHLFVVVDREVHRAEEHVRHFASVSDQVGIHELLDVRPILFVVDVLPRVQSLVLWYVELLIGEDLPQSPFLHLEILGRNRPNYLPITDIPGIEISAIVVDVLIIQIVSLVRHY
jgi:hypothetical protein